MDIHTYLTNLNAICARRNGTALANELSLSKFQPATASKLVDRVRALNISTYCQSNLADASLSDVVSHRLSAMVGVFDNDFQKAFEHLLISHTKALDLFCDKEVDKVWVGPTFIKLSNDLICLAEKADKVAGDDVRLRECSNALVKGWTAVFADKSPVLDENSRKRSIFAITNLLFKLYFKMHTLHLCGRHVTSLNGIKSIWDNLRAFPVSDVVLYKYYTGRLSMFEDKYEDARESLSFALRHTPQSALLNRRRILASLVPVEMFFGVLPSEAVVSVYGLTELYQLGLAIRHGDLRTFNSLITQHQHTLIKLGVYLVLEQAKPICYRSLIKRAAAITAASRVNLALVQQLLLWMGEDVDLDEIECIISNLIYRGQVKGYLSHQKRCLIVSKTDPFPTTAVVKKQRIS